MKRVFLLLALLLPAVGLCANDTLSWTAPTACTDGSAISNCAVTGYRIERSATPTGTFALLTDVGVVTNYVAQNVAIGQNCYRVLAKSATANSDPSNVACKTTAAPAPGAPTNLQITSSAPTAYRMRQAVDGFEMVAIGTIPLGTPCGAKQVDGYNLIPRAAVKLASRFDSLPLLAFAQCG